MAKREHKAGDWQRISDDIAAAGLPPDDSGHDWSSPSYIQAVQSEDALWAMRRRLADLQLDWNATKDVVDGLREKLVDLAQAYVPDSPDDATDDAERYRRAMGTGGDASAYAAARTAATALIEAWQTFERLLADQVADWRAGVAVAEKNLEWERYNAQSGGETQ